MQRFFSLVMPLFVFLFSGCSTNSNWQDPGFLFEPEVFEETLRARSPQIRSNRLEAPFVLPRETKSFVQKRMRSAEGGKNPIHLLVALLTEPAPNGLGIEYNWQVSASAKLTLQSGRGDCVSLANVLVGMGRTLGWPIYFAEAQPENPSIHQFSDLAVLTSHMVVVVLTQEGPVVVDFLGRVNQSDYEIHPIDDLTAYAHLINNVAGHQVIDKKSVDHSTWEAARQGFELASQIQPNLGRAWNNMGIAYTRLGQFDNAREAYEKATELNTLFGSPAKNLQIMETRSAGKPAILRTDLGSE